MSIIHFLVGLARLIGMFLFGMLVIVTSPLWTIAWVGSVWMEAFIR